MVSRPHPSRELGAGSTEARVSRLAAILRGLVPAGCRLAGVGIGASGPVELPAWRHSESQYSPLVLWFGDLAGSLRAELDVEVLVDNDAVTAAIGEYRCGAGHQLQSASSSHTRPPGIGVALLENGRPVSRCQRPTPRVRALASVPEWPAVLLRSHWLLGNGCQRTEVSNRTLRPCSGPATWKN